VLGLRRGFRHKILPLLALLIAFVPAIASVSLAVLLPKSLLEEDLLISYGDYYFFSGTALALFAAFVAPEALCTDRRTRLLDLYLAGPLDLGRYLASKWVAVLGAMSIMTVGPLLFMLVAYAIEDAGPTWGGLPLLLVRIALAGLVVALLFAAVSLGVSSLTPRKGVAAISVVLVLFVPSIAAGVAVDSAGAPEELGLLSAAAVGAELPVRIFAEESEQEGDVREVATWVLTCGWLAWVLVSAAVCWLSYRWWARRR
jgi:ABC-type transport system involved in multi-copper enzyme maturation permease subunit